MAIKFKVLEIGNPADPMAVKKFYARTLHSGEITIEDLAEDISHASSITESDVFAVLQSLVREIPRNIARGNIVRLGNLGSFRLSAKSTGSDLAEEVTAANIKGSKLLFHPGKQIAKELASLTYKKQDP